MPHFTQVEVYFIVTACLEGLWTIQQGGEGQVDKVVLPSSKIIHILLWLRVGHVFQKIVLMA